jgi:hypothetical protein
MKSFHNTLFQFRELLSIVLRGNTLVGKALKDDLSSLSFDEEIRQKNYFGHDNCIDIGDYFRDAGGQPYSLKTLQENLFSDEERSSCFQEGAHSAITDARYTMKLYLKMYEMKKQGKMPPFNFKRPVKKGSFKFTPGDICKCKK